MKTKTTKTILFSILLGFNFIIVALVFTQIVEATGGAFPFTKMGAKNPGDNDTEFGGARRKRGDGESGTGVEDDPTKYVYPIGVYGRGECTQCHEPHASYGGSEPYPNITDKPTFMSATEAEGPDPYLLFSNDNAALCWTCHETFLLKQKDEDNPSGSFALPKGYSSYGFYQGKTVYENSTHGKASLNTKMVWPDAATGADIHPRRERPTTIDGSAQKGYCLNCHTPHGIMTDQAGAYDTAAVPAAKQLASANLSVTTDYLIPRQLIAWEEALCENCHDADGTAVATIDDIQTEINKRSDLGFSGHPVDDTSLAGRHFVGESLPVEAKHVECYDCHNPHADRNPTGVLGDGNAGRIEGMKYIDISGTVKNPAAGDRQPYIMELCFKCHGDSYNCIMPYRANGASLGMTQSDCADTAARPLKHRGVMTGSGMDDQMGSSNKRKEFDSTTAHTAAGQTFNTAFHPVGEPGRNTSLQLCNQLQSAFSLDCTDAAAAATSLGNLTINCTDCHNNNITGDSTRGPVTESSLRSTDKGSNYAGTEPVGPHGSTNPRILRANYNTSIPSTSGTHDKVAEAINSSTIRSNFALCFLCHNDGPFTNSDYNNQGENWTNFHGPNANEPEWQSSLHWYHLGQEVQGGIKCHECHNNVHSNVESNNMQYEDGSGNGFPADGDTHLINFGPAHTVDSFAKPAWYRVSANGVFRCNLRCHSITMTSCSYQGLADGGLAGGGRCGR